MRSFLEFIPLPIVLLLCLTLGLAPFVPQPHLFEKLRMLISGTLSKPVDIFDLILHASPFLLLAAKLMVIRGGRE